MEIEHISYKHGVIDKPSQRKKLRARHLEKENIPNEIAALIEENEIMAIQGALGSKEGGFPIEYEDIKISADGKETRFEIYNRGISMFTNETAELKRVFEFRSKLQSELRL